MIREGCIALFRFPQTDQGKGKLRPALVIRALPGSYNDWLICMISSQLRQAIENFDETLLSDDADFIASGLSRYRHPCLSRHTVHPVHKNRQCHQNIPAGRS